MKYGLVFAIDVHDFENEKDETVITRPSDFLQLQRWKGSVKDVAEDVYDVYVNYGLLYFAAKREGRAEHFGFSDKRPGVKDIDKVTERFSIYVNQVEEDSLPTQAQTK